MTILVTGATGNIGRLIVDHLIKLGANDIRALTTNPAKADLPDGVTPITGYLGRPETLPPALEGVERMYLAPLPPTVETTLGLVRQAGRPPVESGYDPHQFWTGPDDPEFSVLRLDPWRVQVHRMADVAAGRPSRIWRAPSARAPQSSGL